MLTTPDLPNHLVQKVITLRTPPGWSGRRNGLRLLPVYDVDFTNGLGVEQLTFNSASAGSAGQGKHVLVRTDAGGLTWVPAPAGVHSGWRGIQLVSGLSGNPAGWIQVGLRRVYHLGSGWGISWQYPDGSVLPDVSFVPSAPARTNYVINSRGPSSFTGWTITDVAGHPEWSPHGARRFYNNSGYYVGGGNVGSWPGGSAHWEVIFEHGGDASNTVARITIRNNNIPDDVAFNGIHTITGNTYYQGGDYYGKTVLTSSGPNGGTVTRLWCGMNSLPIGNSISYNLYPTDADTNRSTIIHHLEARIGETAVIGPPIFTNGTAETVLAETTTIEDATIDDGPFTLILDLAPEIYPRGNNAVAAGFGTGLAPAAVQPGGAVFLASADDTSEPVYQGSTFPAAAARVAVRRQMPGGTIEFYSAATWQSYAPPEGKTYTKTGGARLLLGTWAHNIAPPFYLNRPLKRIQVYKAALTNEEIALA